MKTVEQASEIWCWGEKLSFPRKLTVRPYFNKALREEDVGKRPESIPETWGFIPFRTTEEGEERSAHYLEPKEEAIARRKGYCGLSGKPEFEE